MRKGWHVIKRWLRRIWSGLLRWFQKIWVGLLVVSSITGIVAAAYIAPSGVFPTWTGLGSPSVTVQGQEIRTRR